MGAVRMRVQTADKNITIIYTTLVNQLMSWEVKSCMCVRNKIYHKCISGHNKKSLHNNVSSSEKYKKKSFSPDSDSMFFFFTGGSVFSQIINSYEVTVIELKYLNYGIIFLQTCKFPLLKTLIDGLESCGLFCVMFLLAVWTLILTAPIHCNGSICEQVI